MIEFIASLPRNELALLAYLWLCISIWVTVWICPRLFRYVQRDDE